MIRAASLSLSAFTRRKADGGASPEARRHVTIVTIAKERVLRTVSEIATLQRGLTRVTPADTSPRRVESQRLGEHHALERRVDIPAGRETWRARKPLHRRSASS